MSQRNSGKERQPNDFYSTPSWTTRALLPHIPENLTHAFEPAAGDGAMVGVLRERFGQAINACDIAPRASWIVPEDFLVTPPPNVSVECTALITNPPYECATAFIEKALSDGYSFIAFLLRCDFDHAKRRRHCSPIALRLRKNLC